MAALSSLADLRGVISALSQPRLSKSASLSDRSTRNQCVSVQTRPDVRTCGQDQRWVTDSGQQTMTLKVLLS